MRLQGKSAIVTGAASGFGRAIATAFIREGAFVVIADRNEEGAHLIASELGERAIACTGDVASLQDVAAMVECARRHFGGLDIVVNNAGILNTKASLTDVDEETFDRLFATNVKSHYCMARAAVPLFREQGRGGCIINLGSTGAIRPRPGVTWYNGTKGAVHAITKSMAIELAPDRIRVNGIAPVTAPTGMLDSLLGGTRTAEGRDSIIATIPLGRLCEPEDVANTCLYLADDRSSFITGAIIPVDGGRTI